MEYKDQIILSDKEVEYIGVKTTRDENTGFIKVNGDIENIIHVDEEAAYKLLKRIGLEKLAPGVIVAGELTKQKLLSCSEITGIPYTMRTAFKSPLVVNNEIYVNYHIKEIGSEPGAHHYEFFVKEDERLLMKGNIVTIDKFLWSMNGKRPQPLKNPILNVGNRTAEKDTLGRFYKSLGENGEQKNSGPSRVASSFIPPKLIKPIRDTVDKEFDYDPERQYMFNSQELIVYKKDIDLSCPLSFECSSPLPRKRGGKIFCNTILHVKSKGESVIESKVLGAAI